MARPEILTKDVKDHILRIKLANPQMRAKDVIESVKDYLIEQHPNPNGKWTRGEIEAIVEDEMLSETSIIKHLTELNKSIAAPSELDKSWHLGILTKVNKHPEYYIPPESIPYIIDIQKSNKTLTSTGAISIRQAIWISRLFPLIKETELLGCISWHYAFHERISEIARMDFDSTEYDRLLSRPKELLKRFEDNIPSTDYSTYKKAFGQVTLGVEYVGPSLPVDHLLIYDNKVYATIMIKGKPKQIEMPYSAESLLEATKSQKIVKSIKKLKSGVTVIRFKETISLAFENEEYNERLHNFIKDGEA